MSMHFVVDSGVTVVQQDSNSTNSWTFAGTETGRQSMPGSACWRE